MENEDRLWDAKLLLFFPLDIEVQSDSQNVIQQIEFKIKKEWEKECAY